MIDAATTCGRHAVISLADRALLLLMAALGSAAGLDAPAHGPDGAGGSPSAAEPTVEVGFTVSYAESIPDDAWAIISGPVRWSEADWLEAAAIGAIGVTLYGFDTRIRTWDQDHRSARTDRWAKDIRPFGRQYIAIPLVGAAGGSFISDDPRLIRTALLGGESLATSLAGYGGMQVLTNRARPSSDEGRAHWHGPGFTHDQSFPSGEVTAAFSCATILAEEWKDLPGAAPVSYGVASLVALERINDNAHWASDVFTAAVLGYGVSQAVERLHPMTSTHLGIIAIVPIVTAREKALSVTLSF
jgi:hypothetical protein